LASRHFVFLLFFFFVCCVLLVDPFLRLGKTCLVIVSIDTVSFEVRMQEDGNGELWRFLTIISNSVPESEFKQLNECLRGFAEDLEGVFENLRDSSLILIIHRCSC